MLLRCAENNILTSSLTTNLTRDRSTIKDELILHISGDFYSTLFYDFLSSSNQCVQEAFLQVKCLFKVSARQQQFLHFELIVCVDTLRSII